MNALYATILVMVVTNQRILLAADSRKTYLDNNGIHKTGIIDKIYETNEYFYAVCGFHEEENVFSIHRLLHDCLIQFSDLHKAVNELTHSLAVGLKNYFASLKKSSPAVFHQLKINSASAGEVFLIKRFNHIPIAYLLDYHLIDDNTLKIRVTSRFTSIMDIKTDTTCYWRAVGNTGVLPTALAEKEWALQPEVAVKKVIEEGMHLYPTFVSPPINMVELTTSGIRWIEKTATAPNHV